MGSVFDSIKQGLEEAIAYERGELDAQTTKLTITPTVTFEASEIRSIRNSAGMTQVVFAKYMGVSTKTVEAWESGRNHPEGPACRLLEFTKDDPSFPVKMGVVSR